MRTLFIIIFFILILIITLIGYSYYLYLQHNQYYRNIEFEKRG